MVNNFSSSWLHFRFGVILTLGMLVYFNQCKVREQQEKLDNLERIASNEQKNLAKEISKMVQKEFWNKVEKVAFLFHEKRNGYLDRIFVSTMERSIFRRVRNYGP